MIFWIFLSHRKHYLLFQLFLDVIIKKIIKNSLGIPSVFLLEISSRIPTEVPTGLPLHFFLFFKASSWQELLSKLDASIDLILMVFRKSSERLFKKNFQGFENYFEDFSRNFARNCFTDSLKKPSKNSFIDFSRNFTKIQNFFNDFFSEFFLLMFLDIRPHMN